MSDYEWGLICPSYWNQSGLVNPIKFERELIRECDKIIIIDSSTAERDVGYWKEEFPSKDFVGLNIDFFDYFNLRDYLMDKEILDSSIIADFNNISGKIKEMVDPMPSNFFKQRHSGGGFYNPCSLEALIDNDHVIKPGIPDDDKKLPVLKSTFEPKTYDDILPTQVNKILVMEGDLITYNYWHEALYPERLAELENNRAKAKVDFINQFNPREIVLDDSKMGAWCKETVELLKTKYQLIENKDKMRFFFVKK